MASAGDPSSFQTTELTVGDYRFTVRDRTNRMPDGRIYGRNFQMGGAYPDCVNVSIQYDQQGRPTTAKMPTLMFDPECSKGVPLAKHGGMVLMIRTLLRHIHQQIPEITAFQFEDKSSIECGTQEEIDRKKHRKRGTHAIPIPLYYFSIAFNGRTWYEKYMNAIYRDPESHAAYRAHISTVFEETQLPPFEVFLREAQPQPAVIDELSPLYHHARTYHEFFTAIPMAARCRHARQWLIGFVSEKMKGVFSNTDWVIRMEDLERISAGTRSRSSQRPSTRRRQQHRSSRRKTRSATEYPPNAVIRLQSGGVEIGADYTLE